MANRRVGVELTISGVRAVESGMQRAGTAASEMAKRTSTAAGQMASSLQRNEQSLNSAGTAATAFGVAAAAGLFAAGKAAMGWESDWVGVQKTVDGTAQQMSELEGELRNLARTMPATHHEIAAVAEAAGQLGVAREDVTSFTRTMIQLGETTNLSADEAATTLQQFMNIMGTAGQDVGRLGATVVALGNAGASTERDIVQMGQRIAAAGKGIGMSETDVMGFANALASLGVEAEAGGTAISMTFKQVEAAVREGGGSLQTIATTAGMTSDAFRAMFSRDSAGAINAFVEGLGKMKSEGGDVNGLLSELEIKGIRQTDSLLRLASATKNAGAAQNLLRDSLALGKSSWIENTALLEEYAKRSETTESKARVAWNNIKDALISAGQALLPIISQIAGVITGLAQAFGSLSPDAQRASVAILAVASGAALGIGGMLKLAAAVSRAVTTFQSLGIAAKTATLSMGAVGVVLTVASIALGNYMKKQASHKALVDELTAAIRENNGALGANVQQIMAKKLADEGFLAKAKELGLNLATVTQAASGNKTALAQVNAELDRMSKSDPSQKGLQSGSQAMYKQVEAARTLKTQLGELSGSTDEAMQKARLQAEATGKSGDASSAAAVKHEQLKIQIQQEQQALEELIRATQAYGNELLAQSNSLIGVEAAIAGAQKVAEQATKDFTAKQIAAGDALNLTTEKGRANQQALNTLAQASMGYISTLATQGASQDEVARATNRAQAEFVNAATKMGMARAKAEELAAAYFAIPETVTTDVSAPGLATANAGLGGLAAAANALDGKTVTVWVKAGGMGGALGAMRQAKDGGVFSYYANGGLENHVAQIAPAGAWRVWAEEETGGEAYIPLAPSKRSRSLDIMHEVARRFGQQVIPLAGGAVVDPGRISAAPRSRGIDYDRLAAAMSGGGGRSVSAAFNITEVNHPELTAAYIERKLEGML